jgi:threonine dehydrogenase-like Zn-dependent dehydrogenase
MKGLIVSKEYQLQLVDNIPMPIPGEYDALVHNVCCIICNGTDNEIIKGSLAEIREYPVMLGHESAGYIIACGSKVRNYRQGDLVTRSIVRKNKKYASGWGGFSEYGIVTDYHAMTNDGYKKASQYTIGLMQRVFPVGITPLQAAMTITFKEVYSAFDRIGVSEGDILLIVGDGPVGLCMTSIAGMFNVKELYMLGQNEMTLIIAKNIGATAVYNHHNPEEAQTLTARCARRINHYIDTIGLDATIRQGLPFLAPDGMITVYGLHSGDELRMPLTGMRNWGIRFMQFPIHDKEGAAHDVICQAVLSGQLIPDILISHRFAIEDFQEAFALINKNKAVKVALML